jgi:hypothetical protein
MKSQNNKTIIDLIIYAINDMDASNSQDAGKENIPAIKNSSNSKKRQWQF